MIGTSPAMLQSVRRHPPHRAHRRQCPDPGRERHRQGTGGARNPPPVARAPARSSCGWIWARCRRNCSKASCSAIAAAPSPTPSRTAPAYFRAATGGTLFLDEIGNVPLHLQSKLLTALERREVVPVGAEKPEADRCAADLRHQSRPRAAGRREPVPPGPALSHQHGGDHPAAAARAARGHSAAAGALCRALFAEIQSARQAAVARR